MTTMSFDAARGANTFAAKRSPRQCFAARLAVLQACQEQAPHLSAVFGVVGRLVLAAAPAGALAWLFVFA